MGPPWQANRRRKGPEGRTEEGARGEQHRHGHECDLERKKPRGPDPPGEAITELEAHERRARVQDAEFEDEKEGS